MKQIVLKEDGQRKRKKEKIDVFTSGIIKEYKYNPPI